MFSDIKCITFDLDDTLWPVTPTILRAENELYRWLQSNYPRITASYTLEQLREKRDILSDIRSDIAHDVTELRFHSLLQLAKEFNYPDELAAKGLDLFRQHRNRVTLFADVEATLALLVDKFSLGAITNGNAQLQAIGIGHYFNFVVTAAEVGERKPDLTVFRHAARVANVPVANMMHVGDCAESDVLGALNAGYKSIWLNAARKAWPGGQNPHAVIHAISELPKILNII